jgi:hypothetical protein
MKRKNIVRMEKISIIDNFLPVEEFAELKSQITSEKHFPWYFNSVIASEKKEASPGIFTHSVWQQDVENLPSSFMYNTLAPILKRLNVVVLYRIIINLNHRLPEPYFSEFHSDIREENMERDIAAQWTTTILYMNTNNGYTELETGERIESIENRLASFSADTRHRICTQTDEQIRVLINFLYLSKP